MIGEWLERIIGDGILCDEYVRKYRRAYGKRDLMDIVLDANGMSFLQEMGRRGYVLGYDEIMGEFGCYLNGGYISHNADGYSGEAYCCHEGDIEVRATMTLVLGCRCRIRVGEYVRVMIYVDGGSEVDVDVGKGSVCRIYNWGGVIRYGECAGGRIRIRNR